MLLKSLLRVGLLLGLLIGSSQSREVGKFNVNKKDLASPLSPDAGLRTGVLPRPRQPLAWYSRVPIPKITTTCQSRGRLALAKHCAKYLSCKTKNLGVEKSCKGGYLFDAVTKACLPEKYVNCSVY